jgi:uncharacterized protein YndB with AHSA1/START domain
MTTENQILTFVRSLSASLPAAYFALTTVPGLRHWLCDDCQADPQVGGRLYLWWESGYYASGVFTEIVPESRVAFSWFGREEPGPTEVRISLEGTPQGARLTLEHLGPGGGELWQETVGELTRGWEIAMDNLVSVLDTGRDLRLSRRPTLGIVAGKLEPARAGRLGLPASPGVLVEGLVPGLGAEEAGLQPGDLLIRLGDHPVRGPADLKDALSMALAGDQVPVVLKRGRHETSLTVRLAGRPQPETPPTTEALARLVGGQYRVLNERLGSLLSPIDEHIANRSAGAGAWTIREVLAHLVASERENHSLIAALASDQDPVFASNTAVWVQALVATMPTVAELLESLYDAQDQTLVMIKGLPEAFLQDRKAGFVDLCTELQHAQYHHILHVQQIEALISAAGPGG